MWAQMGDMDRNFPATRAAGLERLAAFAPHMGTPYAIGRNTDHGPDAEASTSALSPYLRRRLLLEREVVAAARALDKQSADKFVQEVFWRSYFKGYLESRPTLWVDYKKLVGKGRDRLATDAELRRVFDDAVSGRTGIEGFDDWVQELVTTQWLHNHARMWFASIWIFTLRLPWALGADFFLRHLIDGDPASNTLSWRWVAGLHTRGQPYVARAENIRRFSDGRFFPLGLNEEPMPLDEPEPPDPVELPPMDMPPEGDVALLLHLDDLYPESLQLGASRVVRIGGLLAHADGAVEKVRQADRIAMADALARAEVHFGCAAVPLEAGWAGGLPVLAAWAPVGPSADALPSCLRVRRLWDSVTWPHATCGFFRVKKMIPTILEAEGL